MMRLPQFPKLDLAKCGTCKVSNSETQSKDTTLKIFWHNTNKPFEKDAILDTLLAIEGSQLSTKTHEDA